MKPKPAPMPNVAPSSRRNRGCVSGPSQWRSASGPGRKSRNARDAANTPGASAATATAAAKAAVAPAAAIIIATSAGPIA